MRKSEVENLIYVALRFKSDEYGIVVDSEGWTKIDDFIYRINFLHGANIIDRIALYSIVKHNPKFTMNVFKTKLKANKLKNEEEVLERELNGYTDYKKKVKYKVIPFIW